MQCTGHKDSGNAVQKIGVHKLEIREELACLE